MWTRLPLLAALLFARNAMAQEGDATYRGYVGAAGSGSFNVQDTNWSDSLQGGLSLGIWPGRRLKDDGTPLSLQEFLQRPNEISLSVGAANLRTWSEATSLASSGHLLWGSVAGGLWLSRAFLSAGVSAERENVTLNANRTEVVYLPVQFTLVEPDLGLAVHLGAVRLSVDYQLRLFWNRAHLQSPAWGRLALGAQALLWDTTLLNFRAYSLHGGGGGASLTWETFPRSTFEIYWRGYFEDGAIVFNSSMPYTRVGLALGTGLWLTRQLRVEPSLGFTLTTRDLPNAVPTWGLSAGASLTRRFH